MWGIHSVECEVPLLFPGGNILPVPYNNFTLTWSDECGIKTKSLETQKRIIQGFVKRVTVYEMILLTLSPVWILMVEAAGVEPASEGQATEASPSAFPVLILVFGSSQGQDQPLTSLLNFPPVAETITSGSLY